MRVNSQTLFYGALICAAVGAVWAWRMRQTQVEELQGQVVNARQELQLALRRAQQLEAQQRQLQAQAQDAVAERQQLQARADETGREAIKLKQLAAKTQAELTRLMQLASAQGVQLTPAVA